MFSYPPGYDHRAIGLHSDPAQQWNCFDRGDFTAIGTGDMTTSRALHTATKLHGGMVLIEFYVSKLLIEGLYLPLGHDRLPVYLPTEQAMWWQRQAA